MTQLTYNEAFDPYHATFRFLRLDLGCEFATKVHFDMFRILDFYLLFPFRIQNMALLSEDRAWRGISKKYDDMRPYGELPDDASVFSKMEPFQRAAATSLVAAGVLSKDAWDDNEIIFNSIDFPTSLKGRCHSLNASMQDVIEILCGIKDRYSLLGRNGLKDRSGLMEFRYDSV